MRTIYHRAFIFDIPIGLGEGMTTISFVLTRSNVKVALGTFKTVTMFPLQLLTTFKYRALMFHLLIILGENMVPDNFEITRSKVTRVTFVINYVK